MKTKRQFVLSVWGAILAGLVKRLDFTDVLDL
jgi:hypothetical protein